MKKIKLTEYDACILQVALKLRKVNYEYFQIKNENLMFLFNFNNNEIAVSHNDRYWFKNVERQFILKDMEDENLIDCVPDTVMSNIFDLNRMFCKRGKLRGYAKIKEINLDEMLINSKVNAKTNNLFRTAFCFFRSMEKLNLNWCRQDSNNIAYDSLLKIQIESLLLDLAATIVMPIVADKFDYSTFDESCSLAKQDNVIKQIKDLLYSQKRLINALSILNEIDGDYNYTKKCFRECLDLADWYGDDLDVIFSRKERHKKFVDFQFKTLYQDLKQQALTNLEEIAVKE